jgi:hypothetical protein
MFEFKLCDFLTGDAKRNALDGNAAFLGDWCFTFFAGKTRRRSDMAARVVDKALAFCLLALLYEIH